jgi:hypothetical protein
MIELILIIEQLNLKCKIDACQKCGDGSMQRTYSHSVVNNTSPLLSALSWKEQFGTEEMTFRK